MERRRHERQASLNMIAYTGVDESNNTIAGNAGRTLNISESGVLLETHVPLAPQSSIFLEIGLGEDIIKMTGTVVRCIKSRGKFFQTGIVFMDCSGDKNMVLKRYINAFKKTQKNRK
jgi:hypothetical protein